jgi:hypothetical protein
MSLLALRKAYAKATDSFVTITIAEDGVSAVFLRYVPVIGSEHYKASIIATRKDINEYIDIEDVKLQLDIMGAQQKKCLNKETCCIDSVHSRGWRHALNCPNFVTGF